jgi:hypothetical protein
MGREIESRKVVVKKIFKKKVSKFSPYILWDIFPQIAKLCSTCSLLYIIYIQHTTNVYAYNICIIMHVPMYVCT